MAKPTNVERFENCDDCPSKGKGVFCELEKMAMDNLSVQKVTNVFRKGQTLFVEGAPPFGLYCITEGNIKVTKTGVDGRESIVRIAKNGDLLGHRSIFTDQNYTATATAIEDTSVCFIDKKYIVKMVQDEPTVAYNIIARLGKDLGASETKIASFSQRNVFERTCELILLLKSSHGVAEQGMTRLNIKLTREELASMVGTATETLIRIISDLRHEDVLHQEGKNLFIKNEEKLIEYANIDC